MGVLIILILALVIYLIPAQVAYSRGNKNYLAILMLNIFLGWTFIGWVVALVWACTGEYNPPKRKTWKSVTDELKYKTFEKPLFGETNKQKE